MRPKRLKRPFGQSACGLVNRAALNGVGRVLRQGKQVEGPAFQEAADVATVKKVGYTAGVLTDGNALL